MDGPCGNSHGDNEFQIMIISFTNICIYASAYAQRRTQNATTKKVSGKGQVSEI